MKRTRGLSLLEIIVALAVLAGSAVILAQMVDLGARHADRARTITDAQTAAHNLMAELELGNRPVVNTPAEPLDAWSPWDVSIQVAPVGIGKLRSVTVSVFPGSRQPLALANSGRLDLSTEGGSGKVLQDTHQPNQSALRDRSLDAPPTYRLTRWLNDNRFQGDSTSPFAWPDRNYPNDNHRMSN